AYRRLLTAEPALRRAVPVLIIAFLITVGIGAIVQIHERYRQALAAAAEDTAAVAEAIVERLNQSLGNSLAEVLERAQNALAAALVTIRPLNAAADIAVVQPRAMALAAWRSDAMLTVTLFTTTGFVVLILGFAFHWQAMRAREADVIYDTVRSRIDTALNRGRCGLWDWDLARGRVFWSHSMFAILGLKPRDALLSFGEVNTLVHPDDIDLYGLAGQLTDATATLVDHAFRMRHANGNWV